MKTINISEADLYSLLHYRACHEARTQGWFHRYFQDVPNSRYYNATFVAEDYWDGDKYGIEMSSSTKTCIGFLYKAGWLERDYHARVYLLEEQSGMKVSTKVLKEIGR